MGKYVNFLFVYSLILFNLLVVAAVATVDYDYIIQGAGPAGLSAALELRNAGAKNILIIEKRELGEGKFRIFPEGDLEEFIPTNQNQNLWATRKRIIAFDRKALERMKELGVRFPYKSIKGMHLHSETQESVYFPLKGLRAAAIRAYLGRDFVAALSISDLEKGLLEKAFKDPHIDFMFGAETDIKRDSVLINNSGNQRLITYKNLIFASGTRAEFEEIEKEPLLEETQYFVVGNFYSPSYLRSANEQGYHITLDTNIDGHKFFQLALDAGAEFVTVYASDSKPIQNQKEVILKVAKNLGIRGDLKGEVQNFTSSPASSTSLYDIIKTPRGGHIILIGDALFSHDPLTGAGTAIALRTSQVLGESLDSNKNFNITQYNKSLTKIEKEWSFLSRRFSKVKTHLKLLGRLFHKMSSFLSKSPNEEDLKVLNYDYFPLKTLNQPFMCSTILN